MELATIDLGDIGALGDGADITLPGGTTLFYDDAAAAPAGFTFTGGSPDIITVDRVNNPIELVSGDTLVFQTPAAQADGNFRVQRISLHLTEAVTPVIPEPTSLGLLGVLGLGIVARRRR